jgi:SAM-dependent methyltransferase
MTFANPDVLAFYKELPFNYGGSVDEHVERIVTNDLTAAYPILPPLLRNHPRVLEVGCGVGWLSSCIAYHYGCDVTAIDFNPVVIERAQTIAKNMNLAVKFSQADLFAYELDVPVELVVSLGVLHHTNNCHEAMLRCVSFVKSGGHLLLGLYHTFGRRPFLEHFEKMKNGGASESDMFREYSRLHHWLGDETHLYSWFRDQVLHPHETQHTLKEVVTLLQGSGLVLVSTSINRFSPIDNLEAVFADEQSYEGLGKQKLDAGQYFPGFCLALFKKS